MCQSNPLWNADGCRPIFTNNMGCLDRVGSPWFFKELGKMVNEDIEMRLCHMHDRSDGDVLVQSIDIYVH